MPQEGGGRAHERAGPRPWRVADTAVSTQGAAEVKALVDLVQGIKGEGIAAAVEGLGADKQDVLMRVLYRGLALGDAGVSSTLFKWHEALAKAAGAGCILRALADKSQALCNEG